MLIAGVAGSAAAPVRACSPRFIRAMAVAVPRCRTGGQKSKLGPRQVKLARQMYDEVGSDGKRMHTVAEIAAEFGVTRPTIYRTLGEREKTR